jgi:GntR family transcriptional regulator
MGLINANTPIPLYFQLQEILRDKLENGQWKPGNHLPSEEELCTEYNVSRVTVRNALSRLSMEGLIERSAGKGTIVARPKVREMILATLTGSYASVTEGARSVVTQVMESEVIEPLEHIRRVLKLNNREKVSKILRIRTVDDVALFWSRAFVPYRLCPDFLKSDFKNRSFFEILENDFKLIPDRSVRTIETELATSRDINYLGMRAGTPLTVVTSICYMKDGTPLEYSRSHFRGDRTKYLVVVKRGHEIDPRDVEI